jgi:putative SOS response-associated peptidase YedK
MCGRYSIVSTLGELWARYSLRNEDMEYQARFNIAPTNRVLTVVDEGNHGSDEQPHGEMLRWGLVPFTAKDMKGGPPLINARSETAAGKYPFRVPMQRRRCLIVADGFYEWRREGKARYPFRFVVGDGAPFAFAGIWDEWKSASSDEVLRTCSILTTQANTLVGQIHDRMPVILRPEDEARWIDSSITDPAEVSSLLVPYPALEMDAFAVSQVVNAVRNDIPECVMPTVGGERLTA